MMALVKAMARVYSPVLHKEVIVTVEVNPTFNNKLNGIGHNKETDEVVSLVVSSHIPVNTIINRVVKILMEPTLVAMTIIEKDSDSTDSASE